jgi:hypothetical protein
MFLRERISEFQLQKLAVLLLLTVVSISACQVDARLLPSITVEETNQPKRSAVPTVSPTSTVEETSPPQKTAIPTDFPPDFPTPDAEEYSDCLISGGRWEVLGFSGPGCNLPTSDGGQACQDSDDCESVCLADPKLVMTDDDPGKEQVGFCSPWKENFGCQVWVEEGRFVEICVD